MATVILDAGHGGYDNGASFSGRLEKDDTLNLVLAVGDLLEKEGVDVLYTRTEDVYQSPVEKAQLGNDSGADYFISIHRNSSPEPNTYSGIQTLVFRNEGIPALLAENINQELEKTGFVNLGISERPNLAVLRRTTMPAVLVEAGFINTEQDNTLFDLKFPEIAQAIANGILQTIQEAEGEDAEGENMDVEQTERNIYTVETGVFMHYTNAKHLAENMQEDGFDCYIENLGDCYRVRHGNYKDFDKAREEERQLFKMGYEARVVCS